MLSSWLLCRSPVHCGLSPSERCAERQRRRGRSAARHLPGVAGRAGARAGLRGRPGAFADPANPPPLPPRGPWRDALHCALSVRLLGIRD